jgi:hypothetical protein
MTWGLDGDLEVALQPRLRGNVDILLLSLVNVF